ncbi:hypothetical protein ACLBX9_28785 [Methylobacterium sp. A49B]
MARKSVRLGNVLLCDYVARGENNKFVLVNAYSGDIVVQQFPASLPFGLYCEHLPDNVGHFELTLDIKISGQLLFSANVALRIFELAPQVIAIPNFLANIDSPSTIEVVITAEGYKDTVALLKSIRIGNFGVAQGIASELSPEQNPSNTMR